MRGVGRTQNLIDTLPFNTRAGIVIPSYEIAHWLKKRIEEGRGKDFLKNIKFFVVREKDDLNKMIGWSYPIFFDHTFVEVSDEVLVKAAYSYAHSASVSYILRNSK